MSDLRDVVEEWLDRFAVDGIEWIDAAALAERKSEESTDEPA